MLDIKKLRKDCLETLHSISDEEFYAWLEMDRKRMEQADKEWEQMTVDERYSHVFATNCPSVLEAALSDGSLNGTPKKRAAKPKTSATAQKSATARQRAPKVRA